MTTLDVHRGRAHRPQKLLLVLGVCLALALVLYLHGSTWWYAPLTLVALVLAHVLVVGGLVFAVARHSRGGGHSHEGGMQLHRPAAYDRLVRVVMLGRERELRSWTLDLGALEPGNSVLDVGSGTGSLLVAAAERVGVSGGLHGVEPSPEMAAHARQKAAARGAAVEIVDGSADSLPYPSASFDAVFCTLVLHHLPEAMQEPAVAEMCRVLRPGGRLVIVEWQKPRSMLRALLSPMYLMYLMHSGGSSPLERLHLEELLKARGFRDVARRSFGTGGALGAVVGRAL